MTITETATEQEAGPWFYAGNGLCFRRTADGHVQIGTKAPDAEVPEVERTIGSETWASIVAHVSIGIGAHAAARALHFGYGR